MSILTTQEQIEFLLFKHEGLERGELAKVIADRIDQSAERRKPSGAGFGELIAKLGEAAAEAQKQKTREEAEERAADVPDIPAKKLKVGKPDTNTDSV